MAGSRRPRFAGLDDDELGAWRAFLFSTQAVMSAIDRQMHSDAGIPHSWFGVLVALSEQPDRTLRQTDLADGLNFSLSRLSHAAGRMIERGWLIRTADASDRRAARLTLTEAGLAALAQMAEGHEQAVRTHFLEPLTAAQLRALRSACLDLIDAIPPDSLSPDFERATHRLGRQ